jgi:GWxTD domain
MVFIVMGLPDNVRYLKDKEVWVYTKNNKFSEINFTFTKRPNQFIEDHFELSRFSEFQPIWFPAVESLRIGENL